ncbi:MAG: hypothetical protein IJF07_07950, partial [Lachnospiraceae bacterium]|nr:hypothetical protein [Lachnospiraceae bacterium]
MELPKNITQIGESDRNCKIYVEDYVVSYIKQLNHVACNKELAVALYGIRKQEENITYIFIYGAGKLDFLHKEARHLSQAQYQEIDKLRKKYFANYDFQGYRILNGEMVEGFHICEQDICRYVAGYAQFYEKNDCMLAYMLDTRLDEPKPEVVNREKYEEVRKRQEERKLEQSKPPVPKEQAVKEPKPLSENGFKKMRMSTAAAFGVLCLVGLSMVWEGQGMEGIMNTARAAMDDLTEQKVPDSQMVMNTKVQNSTLIAQDKLAEAMQQEGTKVTPENSSLNSETSDGITQGQQLTTNKEMTQTPVQTTSTDVAPIAEGNQTAGASAGETQTTDSEGGQTAGTSAGEAQNAGSEGGQTAGTSAGEAQNAGSEGGQTAG